MARQLTKESIALFSFSYGNINFWWELDSLASLEVWMNKPQRHKGRKWMCFCVGAIQSRWQLHSTRTPRFSHRAPLKGNGDGREFSVSSVRPFLFLIIQTVLLSHSDRVQIQMQRDSYSKAGFSLREWERLIECKTGMLMHRYAHFRPCWFAITFLSNWMYDFQ